MRLVHRTNYWGSPLKPRQDHREKEVDYAAVWTQAVWEKQHLQNGCCRGFGSRRVHIDLTELPSGRFAGRWCLFLVSRTEGHSSSHYFLKFAFFPVGMKGYSKEKCRQKDWTFVGEVDISDGNAVNDLEDLLQKQGDSSHETVHYHVAIGGIGSLEVGHGNR